MDELGRPRRGGAGVWGDDDGASLVEMALVLVLLVMLLVGNVGNQSPRPVAPETQKVRL